eukprot:2254392-Alexandrium_andersonii.AAC.1
MPAATFRDEELGYPLEDWVGPSRPPERAHSVLKPSAVADNSHRHSAACRPPQLNPSKRGAERGARPSSQWVWRDPR